MTRRLRDEELSLINRNVPLDVCGESWRSSNHLLFSDSA